MNIALEPEGPLLKKTTISMYLDLYERAEIKRKKLNLPSFSAYVQLLIRNDLGFVAGADVVLPLDRGPVIKAQIKK